MLVADELSARGIEVLPIAAIAEVHVRLEAGTVTDRLRLLPGSTTSRCAPSARRLLARLGHCPSRHGFRGGAAAGQLRRDCPFAQARHIGALLVVGGTLLAGSFGLWLVALGHWGYATTWVDAAIGLLILVVVIGSVGGQRPKQARKLAAALSAQQFLPSEALGALLGDRVARTLHDLAVGALLAIIVLMMVKPGSPHQ
jgi:uncharacterized membrane protein